MIRLFCRKKIKIEGILHLSRDLVEFRIDHVAAIDYDKLTKLTESEHHLYNLDAELKVFEKPPEGP